MHVDIHVVFCLYNPQSIPPLCLCLHVLGISLAVSNMHFISLLGNQCGGELGQLTSSVHLLIPLSPNINMLSSFYCVFSDSPPPLHVSTSHPLPSSLFGFPSFVSSFRHYTFPLLSHLPLHFFPPFISSFLHSFASLLNLYLPPFPPSLPVFQQILRVCSVAIIIIDYDY